MSEQVNETPTKASGDDVSVIGTKHESPGTDNRCQELPGENLASLSSKNLLL